MSYDKETFVSSNEDGIVYEIQYNDAAEVRSMLSHAPSLRAHEFLGWVERSSRAARQSWDVKVVPLETGAAGPNANNAVRNYDG